VTSEIREPTLSDVEALGRMHHASWVEAYGSLLPPEFWRGFEPENRIAVWRHILAGSHPARRSAMALVDGAVVGVAHTGPGTDGEGGAFPAVRDTQLDLLYVLESQHGTGMAQRLLEAVLPPGTPAQLWVFEHNPRARRFYQRNGFLPDGARHVFGPELGHQPEIRLVR
jgi:GNAT superfamily N-acetyltransferase